MSFIKKLFLKEPPSENDMLSYALSKIKLPYSDAFVKALIKGKNSNLSGDEIDQLEAKCAEIFKFCISVPAVGDAYDEHVRKQYPFLSNRAIGSLRGKAFLIMERGLDSGFSSK